MVGLGGRAVNDDKIIGEHAWRLLKSFNFDPKELRGIGIQIHKLEPIKNGSNSTQGVQSVLAFSKVGGRPKESHPSHKGKQVENEPDPNLEIQALTPQHLPLKSPTKVVTSSGHPSDTSTKPEHPDLPSFSQLDMSVFEALPKEVREELELEYKRRSGSPALVGGSGIRDRSRASSAALRNRQPFQPLRKTPQITRQPSHPLRNQILKPKPGVFPQKSTFGNEPNYKRITQQLAPRSGANIYANKSLLRALGLDKPKKLPVRVTPAALQDLDIDPEVFAMLPVKIQREQLLRARLIKKNGSVPDAPTQRKILKPAKPLVPPLRRRRFAYGIKALYVQPPILRQQGRDKKEKMCYFETDDVQSVIEKWVKGYQHWAPKEKDIEFFSKYLLQCVESKEGDMGLERAVAVMKWWLVLLRRVWGALENVASKEVECKDANERAALAWWVAFREVKRRLDEAAKRRFGGKLSLK